MDNLHIPSIDHRTDWRPGPPECADDATSCRRLWIAVLLAALRDVKSRDDQERRSAVRFLESDIAHLIAGHAGISRPTFRLETFLSSPSAVPPVYPARI